MYLKRKRDISASQISTSTIFEFQVIVFQRNSGGGLFHKENLPPDQYRRVCQTSEEKDQQNEEIDTGGPVGRLFHSGSRSSIVLGRFSHGTGRLALHWK